VALLLRQLIYGRKIIPLLKVMIATTKTTMSAGTTFKSFIARPYRRAEIVSVQNCTIRAIVGSYTQVIGLAAYRNSPTLELVYKKKWPPQKKAATSIQRCAVAYILIADP
jgi:hypothetical protein